MLHISVSFEERELKAYDKIFETQIYLLNLFLWTDRKTFYQYKQI